MLIYNGKDYEVYRGPWWWLPVLLIGVPSLCVLALILMALSRTPW